VGITSCPAHRFYNCRFGYYTTEQWYCMVVALMGSSQECKKMERFLIKYSQATHSETCCNIKPGGEGVSDGSCGKWYLYVVFDLHPRAASTFFNKYPRRLELERAHLAECHVCQRYGLEDA